ncbi:MAG: hypothetical protein WCS73_11840, partial [Lentisphaeria bacterium]
MRAFFLLFLFGAGLFLTSCRTLEVENNKENAEEIKLSKQKILLQDLLQERLTQIDDLISAGAYSQAEIALLPLLHNEECAQTVAHFQKLIQTGKAEKGYTGKQAIAKQKMLNEAEAGLDLPEKYGNVVVIDANLSSLEMPEGAMEKLLMHPITLNSLEPVGIKELVTLLNRDGMNIVADEALQESKKLLINVKDVPIPELFSYIARNMGVAFYIGENLVWVTEGETGAGAKLETRIIRLRKGFIPKVPAGVGAPGSTLGSDGGVENEEDNDLNDALDTFLADSPEGALYKIFPNRNIVMVRNTRENIRLAEKIIREFDRPPYQVIIEARFIEISQSDLQDLGVNWSNMKGGNTSNGSTDSDGNVITNSLNASGNNSLNANSFLTVLGGATEGGSMTLSGVLGNRTFDMVLKALETKESSVTLSIPRVTVLNNRTARLRKGMKYYYFEEY